MSEFKLPPKSEFCTFEDEPVICTPVAAWVFRDGNWVSDDDVWKEARVWSAKEWLSEFPDLPPLPKFAFQFADKYLRAAE